MTSAVTAWRLFAKHRAKTALKGTGAAKHGGRWNLPGTRMIYASESRALAALEILVHVEELDDLGIFEWQALAIATPSDAIERPRSYPAAWRAYPCVRVTQEFGTEWALSGRSVALRVPSAVVPGEFNLLFNPEHPDFSKLRRSRPLTFRFDARLASRTSMTPLRA